MSASDCNSCIVGAEPDGYCEVYNRKLIKKSRKIHRCCECGNTIAVGSQYEYTFTVFEGDSHTDATCMICMDIRDTFYCRDDGTVHLIGRLWEDINESDFFRTLTFGCIAKLRTPAAKQYLQERWQKWKGLR